jgi:hypothetical protein
MHVPKRTYIQHVVQRFRRSSVHQMEANKLPLLVRVVRNPKQLHANGDLVLVVRALQQKRLQI